MRSNWHRALLVSFFLIMSSLAGCIGNDDKDDKDDELQEGQYGTVMVSTYHVGEIVKAIAGDTLNVQMMSQTNIPVHDYTPTLDDIVRMSDADLFLHHGLGLEPWVESTLEGLGSEAPEYIEGGVHTMPTGEISLDYETMLVDKLCDSISNPSATVIHMLAEHAEDAGELHGDDGAHNLGFPEDDHDDDGDEGEHEEHEEHDHGDHEMLMPEDSLEASSNCPTGTVISVYHFEAGEYMLEFEGEDVETFMMAIAAMGGAHHHHHHGHGDGPFEWAGIFEMNDDTHTWSMQKVGGDYADPTMRLVLIPTDTVDEDTMHRLEGGVEELMDGDCAIVEDGETMTPIAAEGTCFELHVGSGDDSMFTIDTAGVTGMAMYAQHVPTEFERDQHYLKDSAGTDIEPVAQEGAGAHGHGGHGEEGGHDGHEDHDGDITPEEAMQQADTNNDSKISWEEFDAVWEMDDDHDHEEHEEACHDTSTHETHDEYTNEADCEAAGHMWMEDHDEEGCHDTTTHETHDEYTNEADCEAAGHMWMEDEHDPLDEAMEEYLMGMFMEAFNESDEDGDSLLDIEELSHFIEAVDAIEDMDFPGEVMLIAYDEDGDDLLSFDEFMHSLGMEEDDHDHDNHTGDGQGNETHDENETMEEMFTEMFHMMFNMSDADGDGYLNATEIESMMEEMMEEDHEEGVAFIGLHIEEEGEYGIALPAGVELHVLMAGGHDGHDHGGHDDHSGHDDHDEGHDDHSDEGEGAEGEGAEEELAYDPHSWLDPVAMAAQTDVVLAKLIEVFPEGEDVFTVNANTFKAELITLDEKYKTLTSTCTDRTVAANHNAYSYLAYRYDIDFVTVHGLDPEGEPSAEDVVKVVDRIEEDGITVLFVEEYTDQSSVQSIVDQTGVDIQILYTMEMAPSDSSDDYLSMMNKNFDSLEEGMTCSA